MGRVRKGAEPNPFLIYNLFPRIAGAMSGWNVHLERAKDMGFNWLYINPINYSGFSGSLYSIKDYYKINPLFLDNSELSEEDQVRQMIAKAHALGLKVMFDLVINHTAIDCDLTKTHSNWYVIKDKKIQHPQVWEGDKLVTTWGDLAEIDNENSPDKEHLWVYWKELITYYLNLGVDGFRCDAAYQVPVELWAFLIKAANTKAKALGKKVFFCAETLGCEIEKVIALAEAGFEYTFNSSKWWDLTEPWCLNQYEKNFKVSKSIAFAESHDTKRLMKELDDNVDAVKLRYLFSVIFSTGTMMPIGFEYGFVNKVNVVKTMPSDWETTRHDLTAFITSANQLKYKHAIFNEDNETCALAYENNKILILKKTSNSRKQTVLIAINKSLSKHKHLYLNLVHFFGDLVNVQDVSLDYPLDTIGEILDYHLRPAQVMILLKS